MCKDLKLKFDKIVNSPELSLTETEFNSLNESYERLFSQEDTTDFDGVERTLAVASTRKDRDS